MVHMKNYEGAKNVICTFCGSNCGVLVHTKGGQITRILGNPNHPLSRGYICERIKYATKWLYHPDQLKHPYKRVGERGDNKWQRITWEQALDEIAEKLIKLKQIYGAETLALTEGTKRGALHWESARFLSLFGNPYNVAHCGIICAQNRGAVDLTITGSAIYQKGPSSILARNTNCYVLWASNITEAVPRGAIWLMQERRKRPMKFIVIDPRTTKIAEVADMHLKLRPGTDCALALAWVNIIINEHLYDREFVKNWTIGFDDLARRAQDYTPQRVAGITGLTADLIVESARMYATAKPAVMHAGVATDQLGLNSGRVEQTQVILQALTGNIDIAGGSMMETIGLRNEKGMVIHESLLGLRHMLPKEQRQKQLGVDRFKVMGWKAYELILESQEKVYGVPTGTMHFMGASPSILWRAILTREPYPVTAMISWEDNPLIMAGNTRVVYEAVKSKNLELYVVNEYWMTPSALLADYVLPIASWLERAYISARGDSAIGGEKAIEPLGERKDDYFFWRELGMRLGQEKYWPWKTFEEHIADRVKPLGITYEEFIKNGSVFFTEYNEKKYEKRGFATPSGKLELSSSVLEKLGYDPLPFYEEPAESPIRTPDIAKEYPLILNTGGRFMPQFHSEHRQPGTGMRERNPDPVVDINSEDANKFNIKSGDWIYIETIRGRIKQKARVSSKIIPGVVNAQASWWFPEMPGEEPYLHGLWESNANVLTLDDPNCCDPLTGGWQNRALLCKIYKV